ncbi:class I SAM-dependent methyltransferase [Streptomyces sp. URMC 123]|uniref:class I SAM-dependent methyltransferase n=1 Tax=Streptomyces sp. URMC 123 TaxID=3423403 RepID=UPI003F1990C2
MSGPGDPRSATATGRPPQEYWGRPDVVTAFGEAAPPAYLSALVPRAARPDDLAVDVGCGAGRNLPLLARRGYRLLALDLHREMLTAARDGRGAGGCYAQADACRIPLADAAASVLVCHGVLHNLPDREAIGRALTELRRVAAPAAVLSLNLFSSDHVDPALTRLGPDRFALDNGQVMTLLPPHELRRKCTAAGWGVVDGPHQYLSAGDPGTRSVWRAALEPVE